MEYREVREDRRMLTRRGVTFVAQTTNTYTRRGRTFVSWSNVSSRTARQDLGPRSWRAFKVDGSPLSGGMRAERWARLRKA